MNTRSLHFIAFVLTFVISGLISFSVQIYNQRKDLEKENDALIEALYQKDVYIEYLLQERNNSIIKKNKKNKNIEI